MMVGASEGIGGEGGRPTRLTLSSFLSAVAKEGLVALQSELHNIMLPDFTGDFKIKHVGRGHYEFHRWGSLLLGPEPAGQGWEPGEGGGAQGLGQGPSGTDSGVVSHRVQKEVQGGNWLLSLLMKQI